MVAFRSAKDALSHSFAERKATMAEILGEFRYERKPMNDPNPYDVPPEPTPLEDLDFTPTPDDRNLAIIAHVSGAAGIFAGGLIGFLGPLIIYLMKKDSSPYVADQAKEALNFQITMLLLALVCGVIVGISCGVLFPLMFVPMVLQLVFAIVAALAVRDGDRYRYPMSIRLLQ